MRANDIEEDNPYEACLTEEACDELVGTNHIVLNTKKVRFEGISDLNLKMNPLLVDKGKVSEKFFQDLGSAEKRSRTFKDLMDIPKNLFFPSVVQQNDYVVFTKSLSSSPTTQATLNKSL